jgi:hypothetical protein
MAFCLDRPAPTVAADGKIMSTNSTLTKDQFLFCSQRSSAVGEQLFGTAKRTSTWLLLEYPYLWGRKAFEESDLPAKVKAHLSSFLNQIPESKLLLTKNESSLFQKRIAFFAVISTENQSRIYQFQFDSYADLEHLEFTRLLSDQSAFSSHLRSEPIFLVCTNGKRDPCCAKYGRPVYDQMSAIKGEAVWQSTHLGGHRFATNVLCFPQGILYGRVDENSVIPLIEAHSQGNLLLEKYRGRTCFESQAQAAEYYLRKQTGMTEIEAYRLGGVEVLGSDQWVVKFNSPSSGKVYQVTIFSELSKFQTYTSCSEEQLTTVPQYRLGGIQTI